jgi:2-polyprenyl-6-hydroxyphenyl methylase/3-demethylubiquinone-9 3-methyltransferase
MSADTSRAQPNVVPIELAKFSDVAHRWWDTGSEFRPLHEMNPVRLGWIEEAAGGIADRRVLDVGCGGGILAESMAARGAQVTGIDLSDKALGVARLHGLETGIRVDYRLIAAEALALELPGHFDVVTSMELLEHVPDPASIVSACATLVRPGGTVVFATINRTAAAYLQAVIGAEYVLRLLARGTHDWSRFVRPADLALFGRRAGLDLAGITGIAYNPLTRVFSLNAATPVNYLAAFRRPAHAG